MFKYSSNMYDNFVYIKPNIIVLLILSLSDQALKRAGVQLQGQKISAVESEGTQRLLKVFCIPVYVSDRPSVTTCSILSSLSLSVTASVSGEEPAPIETSLSISLTPVKVNDEAVAADQPASSDVRLSVRQLLVRRGFALLLMFVILTTGVLISEFLINVL